MKLVLSKKEIALLGLVNECPRHGYEIEHVLEERHMRYWTEIGFSSIYHVLKQLEKKELIVPKETSDESPSKKVYMITALGKKELKGSVKSLFSLCEAISVPYLLGIVNLGVMTKEEKIEAFQNRLDMINQHLNMLEQAISPYLEQEVDEPKIFRSWFLAHANTEKNWIENYIAELKQNESC